MRLLLCLLAVACARAREHDGRAKKQPFVVDAVGNTLPPPSNVPATVGSPVNLLTPDRYEFYTFDESGELVKRLMTLEEIQAIVAAGEEAEGLVTFANDNQPTAAFNFSQPSYNKVHSVVTNVQNVLKAQMEAHKNNPIPQPTLDTPDVSDSWSLILPSIFGNTGLDIVPDKIPSIVTPPETDTLEFNDSSLDIDSMSKEGVADVLSNSTTANSDDSLNPVTSSTEEINTSSATTTKLSPTITKATVTTTTTTTTPSTTTSTIRSTSTTSIKTTTTRKPVKKATTTSKPLTVKASTKPVTKLTTVLPTTKVTKPHSTTISSKDVSTSTTLPLISPATNKIRTTTTRPKITSTVVTNSDTKLTTPKTVTSTKKIEKHTSNITTLKPLTTLKEQTVLETTQKTVESNINRIEILKDNAVSDKNTVTYEKINTLIPISTALPVTEKTTQKAESNKPFETYISTTTLTVDTTQEKKHITSQPTPPAVTTYKPTTVKFNYAPSTISNQESEKSNTTTITTQSVSPSTTVSSTEFVTAENIQSSEFSGTKPTQENDGSENNQSDVPLFDVAQSISQIASDLGSNYMPVPTVSNLVDTTKVNHIDLESKENFEIDILSENDTDTKNRNITENNNDNFVKISMLDPHTQDNDNTPTEKAIFDKTSSLTLIDITEKNPMTPVESTTMDKILSESMGDLLSQVVNQGPQSVKESEMKWESENKATTTENNIQNSLSENYSEITTMTSVTLATTTGIEKSENDIPDLELNTKNTTTTMFQIKEMPITEGTNIYSTEKSEIEENTNTYVKISIANNKNASVSDSKLEKEVFVNKIIENNDVKQTESTIKDIIGTTTSSTMKTISLNDEFNTANNTFQEKLHINETKDYKNESSIEGFVSNKIHKGPETMHKIEDFKKKIQKVNIDDKELVNERNNSWKLISTVSPPKSIDEISKSKINNNPKHPVDNNANKDIILEFSKENQGLEVTAKDLEDDIAKFTELCNELAFRYWNTLIENIDKRRSFVLSPYSITSMLAMMFMGARGATSGEMNDILKLDDMVTFNPHFTLKNISDSIETTPESGVIVSAFIRELYSDRTKGKILTFYKERAQQFYSGHVEEINFKLISDIIRRRTNMLAKRFTWGRIPEYMKANTITMQPPLAAFSANIFQTDCTGSSVEGRDGEMYFVVSPTVRQRRLVPVPAVVYRGGFLAGYDPALDATAAALGNTNSIISTLFVMPGQQGNVVHGEDLEALERRLLEANPTTPAWNRLLRTLLPRIGLELQIPRFSHKSIFNISSTLKNMGLKDLFDADQADLGGLNGPSKDLYLSDMIQSTTFVTCGEGVVGEQHHLEEYPESIVNVARRRSSRWASDWDEPRDYQRAFHDPHDVGEAMHLPLHLRPRQARLPSRNAQPARLKFDRPFLYFVRHNPTGMILYVGRYNPRLLP